MSPPSLSMAEHQTAGRPSLPSGPGMERKSSSAKYIQQELHDEQHRHQGRHRPPLHHHPHHQQYRVSTSYSFSSSSSAAPVSSFAGNPRLRPSERYVNFNYRFLVKRAQKLPATSPPAKRDPVPSPRTEPRQQPVEWDSVECVIIPTGEEPKCPICLDCPVAPQVTHCGHFFCWSCLLKYLTATAPEHSPGVNKNWRVCPVCTDQFHQKKIKPVHFFQVLPPKLNCIHQFTLIKKGPPGDCPPGVVCLQHDLAAVRPSPFAKSTELSEDEVRAQILLPQQHAIVGRMKAIADHGGDSDGEMHFLQQSLDQLTERLAGQVDGDEQRQPAPSPSCPPPRVPPSTPATDSVYFHQSSDGQYLFLDALTTKVLKAHFGSYSDLPVQLSAPIREIEAHTMGASDARARNKPRFKYLTGYVPCGATFYLCELDLSGVVPDAVLAHFGTEISIRKEARQQRLAREEFESRSAARRNSLDDGYGLWMRQGSSPEESAFVATDATEDADNFPLPPGMDPSLPLRPAVWYTASQDEPSEEPAAPDSPSLLFNLSLEDLRHSEDQSQAGKGGRKGRNKFVLIGGTHHRR